METKGKERAILLLSARGQLDEDHANRLRHLCAGRVDWEKIYDQAIQHRIFPLVHRNLRTHCSSLVPQEILDQGKTTYRNNGARNLMMVGHLIRILSLLDKHTIPAVPFKGPVLSISLYGDLALRSFGDIDVLIHRKHLIKAVQVLGEQRFLPYFSLNKKQLEKLSLTDNEYPLVYQKSGVTLDLQWEITGGYFPRLITFDDLGDHLKTIEIAGKKVSVFSDEDLLFYLCIHGSQHTWKQLDHVCCVAELIRIGPKLDWEKVFSTAANYRAQRMLRIGLLLAQDLFEVVIPEPFNFQIKKDPRAMELAQQISDKLFSTSNKPSSLVSHRFMKYHLLSMDHPLLAIRYALRLFFIPTRFDWQLYPLPAKLSFLHYIIRPLRLGFEAGKKALMGRLR